MNAPTPPSLSDALRWGYRDAIREYGELLASLAISITESAYRGHDAECAVHVKQARLVLLEAIDVVKKLGGVAP